MAITPAEAEVPHAAFTRPGIPPGQRTEMAMLTPLKMAIVTVFVIVSASTALAQTIPIRNQNVRAYLLKLESLELKYCPPENMSEAE
jgi:hypothetical protein